MTPRCAPSPEPPAPQGWRRSFAAAWTLQASAPSRPAPRRCRQAPSRGQRPQRKYLRRSAQASSSRRKAAESGRLKARRRRQKGRWTDAASVQRSHTRPPERAVGQGRGPARRRAGLLSKSQRENTQPLHSLQWRSCRRREPRKHRAMRQCPCESTRSEIRRASLSRHPGRAAQPGLHPGEALQQPHQADIAALCG